MTHLNIFFPSPSFFFSCERSRADSSALWFCLWKRQCFMAIEGRSHMCISCCTNIVQCRAWNKEKGGGRQAAFSMNDWFAGYSSISIVHIRLSHQQARVPLNQAKRNASLLFKTVKEIWVSWGLRKRNPNLFMEIFLSLLLFPAVTFGNIRTVRAS